MLPDGCLVMQNLLSTSSYYDQSGPLGSTGLVLSTAMGNQRPVGATITNVTAMPVKNSLLNALTLPQMSNLTANFSQVQNTIGGNNIVHQITTSNSYTTLPCGSSTLENQQDTYICFAYNPRCFVIQKVMKSFFRLVL